MRSTHLILWDILVCLDIDSFELFLSGGFRKFEEDFTLRMEAGRWEISKDI